MIDRLRRHMPRLARVHALLFVVLWASMVASPCVMAMQSEPPAMAMHDCPHCPPKPCLDEAAPADCDESEPADRTRTADSSQFALAVPFEHPAPSPTAFSDRASPPERNVRSRDGPRTHLVHVRFDE